MFTRRPSARKLRVLIDLESFTVAESYVDEHLRGLIGYENVEYLFVAMSEVAATPSDGDGPPRQGFVQVRDVTAQKGFSSYPGPRYGWWINEPRLKFDGRTTENSRGGFSPGPELMRALVCRSDGGGVFDGLEISDDDVRRAVLLAELARAIDHDLIISESPTTGLAAVPANDRANFVTRSEAVPIIAHYLRTQQRYILNAAGSVVMSRHDYFSEAVGALGEGILWWRGKCERGLFTSPHGARFMQDAESLIDRLSRALRSRDALIASIGAIQTESVIDDGADALDHCLVCLCGAVDVVARSLHAAQQLPGKERNAKLHLGDGYKQLIAAYVEVEGVEELDRLQKRVNVVFSLRNSIHSQTLAAIASLRMMPDGLPEANVGQIDIVIPEYVATSMSAPGGGGLEFWRVADFWAELVVDLMELVDRSFRVIFEFLDHLCRIISAEPILDKDPVLCLDVIGVQRDALDFPREQRGYLGLPAPGDLTVTGGDESETNAVD